MPKLSSSAKTLLDAIPRDGSVGGLWLQKTTKLGVRAYRSALDELLAAGLVAVGRGRGGSVRRIDDQADYQAFLGELDANEARSNHAVRAALKWDETRYWKVHGELRAQGLIRVGRGRGGTVARMAAEDSEDLEPTQAIPSKMPAQPAKNAAESEWYPLLSFVLEKEWSKEQGFTNFVVQVTAYRGRKPTGGAWTRPDITVVSMQKYRFLPDRRLEVWTFEVKRPGDWSVVGVHEASAHGRRATRPVLLLVSSTMEETEMSASDRQLLQECAKEAARLGIGLIVAYRPYRFENWEVLVDPERHDPSPDLLDGFLETQLLPELQQEIEKWLTPTLQVQVR